MAVDLVKKKGGGLLVEVVLHPLHAEQKLVRQIFNSVLSRALNLRYKGIPTCVLALCCGGSAGPPSQERWCVLKGRCCSLGTGVVGNCQVFL